VEEVDANNPDNDGNTPLIFAAQAGKHVTWLHRCASTYKHELEIFALPQHYKGNMAVDWTLMMIVMLFLSNN
jgi:ankyrin repeat protein